MAKIRLSQIKSSAFKILSYAGPSVVHNAFGKGIEKYGKDIDQLCLDLHALFKYSAARHEDFKEVQLELGLELHNFQQHTEVRWLSMGPAIDRIVEQWDAVTYFVAELAKDPKKVPKSINYKRIHMMLGTKEKATTKVTLQFSETLFPCLNSFYSCSRRHHQLFTY